MHKVKEVAAIFNVTPQTVRNWVSHPLLCEFFSPEARRDDDRAYALFYANDIEVCNSIHTLLKQKLSWGSIAAQLRAGWRDTDLPARAALLDKPVENATHVETVARLAVSTDREGKAIETISQLESEIKTLNKQIHDLEDKVHSLELEKTQALEQARYAEELRKNALELGRMQRELELLNEGRLMPKKTEG